VRSECLDLLLIANTRLSQAYAGRLHWSLQQSSSAHEREPWSTQRPTRDRKVRCDETDRYGTARSSWRATAWVSASSMSRIDFAYPSGFGW